MGATRKRLVIPVFPAPNLCGAHMKSKTKNSRPVPSPERIQQHWTRLCSRIGERRAGSAGDRAAGEYILDQFRAAGLERVHGETFPCVSVEEAHARLAIGHG